MVKYKFVSGWLTKNFHQQGIGSSQILMIVNCIKNLLCDVRFPFLYLHSLESVFRSATLANDVPCRVRHRPAENKKNFKSRAQAAVYQELFVLHLLPMLSLLSFIAFLARFRPISITHCEFPLLWLLSRAGIGRYIAEISQPGNDESTKSCSGGYPCLL